MWDVLQTAPPRRDVWVLRVAINGDVRITHTRTAYDPSRRPLSEGTTDVITVTTRYNLQQKHALSRSDGDTIWGSTLVRRGPGSRWLITEEGVP